MRDITVKWLSRFHTVAFRVSRGRIGKRLVDNDMLLLRTRGRRTNRPHTVPLLFLRDGTRIVVIASYGGRVDNPDWYKNLAADPRVDVQLPGQRWREATARTVELEERDRLWTLAVLAYAGYAEYEARTDRVIPVVAIE